MLMKAVLEYNLPDDDCEFHIAATAMDWALVVWDLDNYLRNAIKYSNKEELQPIRDHLHELLLSHKLNLDMIE